MRRVFFLLASVLLCLPACSAKGASHGKPYVVRPCSFTKPSGYPDKAPRLIRAAEPGYTQEAIRKKVSGRIVLKVMIDTQGRCKVCRVLRSIPELDQEAIRVVENGWFFEPARVGTEPVEFMADLVFTFKLPRE